ncbi:unnamed protein product [Symbiodinium sp. CCMP2592]|nr:unnamed protein product [Symbiodinium sp. CCMP2592]
MSTYIAVTLRKLLTETDIWKPSIVELDKEELSKLSLLCLRAELQTHYKLRRQSDPEWSKKGSEVWNLTLTMLSDKHVKAKAAETHGLLAFVCEMLAKYKARLSTSGSEQDQLFFELATHAGKVPWLSMLSWPDMAGTSMRQFLGRC